MNPFDKLDPLKNLKIFHKLIQNKDKQFLLHVQHLLNKRLLELSN